MNGYAAGGDESVGGGRNKTDQCRCAFHPSRLARPRQRLVGMLTLHAAVQPAVAWNKHWRQQHNTSQISPERKYNIKKLELFYFVHLGLALNHYTTHGELQSTVI